MLMSYVNQQLRDNYDSLDEFCKSMDIDKNEYREIVLSNSARPEASFYDRYR